MLVWGIIYIVLFGRLSMPKSLAAASLITGGAYVLDYHLVPKQYTPGIEKKISKKAIFFTYVVMAATLALSPAINRRKK
jgi:predicted transglutaminase-like protease